MIEDFLDKIQDTYRQPLDWHISGNAGEYLSKIVEQMLGYIYVKVVPIVPHNSEENGLVERFNGTIMNAVRVALRTANISWEYWTWALEDATDKYNQLAHKGTGASLHQKWFNEESLNLRNLFIFGQLGYLPIMNKQVNQAKHRHQGKLRVDESSGT